MWKILLRKGKEKIKMSKCKNIIRKIKRNSSAMNKKADFVQVSYFNFSELLNHLCGGKQKSLMSS